MLLEGLGPPTGLTIAAVSPSPFTRRTEIIIGTPSARVATVSVWSVTGRRVATLARGSFALGYTAVTWDGTGRDGRQAPGGVYLLRVESGGTHVEKRVIKVN